MQISDILASCNTPAPELTSHATKDGDVIDYYIKMLRQHIAANPIKFDDDYDFPALDTLYRSYSESHSMSNTKTKAILQELNEHLDPLPFLDNDQVYTLVFALCAEHERIAFLDGLRLGAQLMMELQEKYEWRSVLFCWENA